MFQKCQQIWPFPRGQTSISYEEKKSSILDLTLLKAVSPGFRFFPSPFSFAGGLLSAPKPNPLDLGMYSIGSARLKNTI